MATLLECFQLYDIKSLQNMAKTYGAKLSDEKDIQISSLLQTFQEKEILKQRMGILDQPLYIQLLEDEDGNPISEDAYEKLTNLDLIYEGEVIEEVKEILKNETEHDKQRRMNRVWLMKCLCVVSHYYGEASKALIETLYKQNEEVDKEEDIIQLFNEIPVSERTCNLIGDDFVIRGYRSEKAFEELRKVQQQYTYYVPTNKEIKDLYFEDEDMCNQVLQLERWYILNGNDAEVVHSYVHEIWNDISYGKDIDEIYANLLLDIEFDNQQEQNEYRELFQQLVQHTRRMDLRGHTILEVNHAS